MTENKCTILVNSCDSYEDLWNPFFTLFKKFYPNCPYEIILNTETKHYEHDGLKIKTFGMHQGEKRWGKRFLDHFYKVGTKYVLIMLDDFFIRDYVKQDVIDRCIELMDEDPMISCFQFNTVEDKNNVTYDKYPIFDLRPKEGLYKLAFQPGVWRVSDLKRYIFPEESPWDIEEYANIRTYVLDNKFLTLKADAEPVFDYGFKLDGMGVYRGKWVEHDVRPVFEANGIDVDFSKRGFYHKEHAKKDIIHKIFRAPNSIHNLYVKYKRESVEHKRNKKYLKEGTWR